MPPHPSLEVQAIAELAIHFRRFRSDFLSSLANVLDPLAHPVSVALPVMHTIAPNASIQQHLSCDQLPYVRLITENKKVIGEMHKDYAQWLVEDQRQKEMAAKKRSSQFGKGGGDWMSIFDAGDMAIQAGNKKTGSPPPASKTGGGDWMSILDAGD